MNKVLLRLTLTFFFAIGFSGCSLFSSSDEEQETATVVDEQSPAADEFASDGFEAGDDTDADFGGEFDAEEFAAETPAAEGDAAFSAGDVEVEDDFGFGTDEYPDDDYGTEAAPVDVAQVDDSFDDGFGSDAGFASDESLAIDEGGGLPEAPMTDNQEEDLFGGDTAPVVDTPVFADSSFSGEDNYSDIGETSGPKLVPVKKMKPAAYMRAGANINRLYVVRSGDTMESISQKIYGADRTEDLYAANSHFRNRDLKVGDKVYYESPINQNDQSMITYYEDNSVSPQYYTSAEGDNIREIAKKLLGHNRSWMEIYATNESVESKGRLPAGLLIRYWPEGAIAKPIAATQDYEETDLMGESQDMAMQAPPVEVADPMNDPMNDPMPIEEVQEEAMIEEPMPAADPEVVAQDDFNPPPAMGSINEPPQAIAPPPPPPPAPKSRFNKPAVPENKMAAQSSSAEMGEDSTIMAALGGLLILAFVIMLIFIRRSRSKRVNFSQTQA